MYRLSFDQLPEAVRQVNAKLDEIKNLLEKQSTQPKNIPEYLTRKQVAKLLHVSTVTIDNWAKKGLLKPHRIGNRIRYKYEEVQQALSRYGKLQSASIRKHNISQQKRSET